MPEFNFVGDRLDHPVERAEIEALVKRRAAECPHSTTGVIHWPESDNPDDCPVLVLRWAQVEPALWNRGEGGLRCTVSSFEAEIEAYEERRRERIAEANEY